MKLLLGTAMALALLLVNGCKNVDVVQEEAYVPLKPKQYKVIPTPQVGDEITFEVGSFNISAPGLSRSEQLELSLVDSIDEAQYNQRKFEYYLDTVDERVRVDKDVVRLKVVYGAAQFVSFDGRVAAQIEGGALQEILEKQRLSEQIPTETWNRDYKQRVADVWRKIIRLKCREKCEEWLVGNKLSLRYSDSALFLDYNCTRLTRWDNEISQAWTRVLSHYEKNDFENTSLLGVVSPMPIIDGTASKSQIKPELLFDKWQIVGGSMSNRHQTETREGFYIAYRIVDVKPKKQFDDKKKIAVMFDFNQTPIVDIIDLIGSLLNVEVVGAQNLKGTVTVKVDKEMTEQEFWEMAVKLFTDNGIKFQLDGDKLFVDMKNSYL